MLFTSEERQRLIEATYAVDLDARAQAEQTWELLLRHVKRYEAHLQPIQLGHGDGAMSGFMVQGPSGGLPIGVLVAFMKDKQGLGGSYTPHPQAGLIITLYDAIVFSDDPDGLHDRLSQIPRLKRTFVHEFTHYLDHQRFKGRGEFGARSSRATRRADLTSYYRTPSEFNAHFQSLAGEIEDAIFERVHKATLPNRAALKRHVRKEMDKHFANFRAFRHYVVHELPRMGYKLDQVEKQLEGSKWERKWHKRLAVLYIGLKRRVFDALR